ncbi:hypothetical protein L226DRAFT_280992 [Lentinus tigrinus ALCF2SS1-7]|uniref:uncharacterized protein n=1 Tax=Lentinus tigrinus ALCF2SS1-7 TaxID=1328758 RepID=UPI001166280F|nr:hypothetical protein L226DRAFT_280992 [Lentinus tigrinus ALCF2SS1-7]
MASKTFKPLFTFVLDSNRWKKLVDPSVRRGETALPQKAADQERLGVRFDYDTEVERDGVVYHKFAMQPNAGKIPSSIKAFRDGDPKGTHAEMAPMYVKKDGTKEDVEEAMKQAIDHFIGIR